MKTIKHLRAKSRVKEEVNPNAATDPDCTMLYTVRVQVKLFGKWVTIWAETCDYSDGDTRTYIKNCAIEVHEALTDNV
jgi:hypothetical protein